MVSATSPRGVTLPLACVALLLLLAPTPAPAFDFSSLLTSVADTAVNHLFKQEEILLYDHYCTLTRRPYFRRWELHYRAQVYCPGWTSIIGKADNHVNPTKAEREATQNFVRQALQRGLITEEQASLWI